ncbi:Imm32 family immunity protein [Amycolatopsis antarctica]|nr:hypothetical protein [Amycolatopsis antarctica]
MIIASSHSAGLTELELSGNPDEYAEFAATLDSAGGAVALDTTTDVAPYEHAIATVEVAESSGREVVISVDRARNALVIRGGADPLRILAGNVRTAAELTDPRHHVHIEYFPGHHYLGEDSLPLTIAAART